MIGGSGSQLSERVRAGRERKEATGLVKASRRAAEKKAAGRRAAVEEI